MLPEDLLAAMPPEAPPGAADLGGALDGGGMYMPLYGFHEFNSLAAS